MSIAPERSEVVGRLCSARLGGTAFEGPFRFPPYGMFLGRNGLRERERLPRRGARRAPKSSDPLTLPMAPETRLGGERIVSL